MSVAPLRILLLRTSAVGAAFRPPAPPAVTAPLGALYLAAALVAELGDAVEIVVESLSTAVASAAELPAFLAAERPDLVGISAALVEEPLAVAVVEAARALASPPVTVIGGPYATCTLERALRRTRADFAVRGEGERTAVELVRGLLRGADPAEIPGVSRLGEDGRVHPGRPAPLADDLDALPLPAWHTIPIETYSRLYNFNDLPLAQPPHVPILTSRGCPLRCAYCHDTLGKRFRPRSPANVLAELELLHDRHGVGEFHVVDDIFNFDAARVQAICRAIERRGLHIALAFPNGVRGELLTRTELELLRRAGCYSITFALESASPPILARMRRVVDLDRLARSIRLSAELGLIVSCFVMFGYPGETADDLACTVRWLRDSHVDLPRYSIVSPFPGTLLGEQARAAGLAEIELARAGYDPPNPGLSTMPAEEFRQRVRRGLAEIMAEPRRQARLRAIWARWPEADHRYMGYPPPSRAER